VELGLPYFNPVKLLYTMNLPIYSNAIQESKNASPITDTAYIFFSSTRMKPSCFAHSRGNVLPLRVYLQNSLCDLKRRTSTLGSRRWSSRLKRLTRTGASAYKSFVSTISQVSE
jgi:hypothetical protein